MHAQRNIFNRLQIGNRKAATRLIRQINQRNQHQQRTEQRVKKQFHRGIHSALPAPHTNNQIQRNQHAFKEGVKQNGILRGKRAVNQPAHYQERRHVLRGAFLYHFPACQYHHQRDKRIQNNKQHGNAVHAQRVVQIKRGYPRMQLGKLIAAAGAVKLGKQWQGDDKARGCAHQREYARQRGFFV